MTAPVRRVVTGHSADGRAIIISDTSAPQVFEVAAQPGLAFTEIWRTDCMPVRVDNAADPTLRPLQLAPTSMGSVIRVTDIPPESEDDGALDPAKAAAHFAQLGGAKASTGNAAAPHPLMHRTETVDYGMVLEGEIYLVLDDSEVLLHRGDVVIQRGTNHAWANRSGKSTRMLFILLDGKFADGLN
ncbi:mannose-6-phosphate isomerase-like protein (cupin superfamily) [Undibacterium sp. GrIS 1.8]|uniref:cupin domain-containing protein n=1 Tax=unclassified Undibacterium TaxID=2630295 RepID=UPI00339A2800